MVNERLTAYLESNYLISPVQCGGRKHRNTHDHLVRLESIVRNTFVKEEYFLATSFDMMKAYDMTWRTGILKYLYSGGIRGRMLKFVANFLKYRKFKIRVNGILSRSYTQENGIPQGRVLSPTLFIVKINGIVASAPQLHGINYSLYIVYLIIRCLCKNNSDIVQTYSST